MLIRTEKINKTYRTGDVELHALTDISLEIEKGEFLALSGPSGSGKTTLLNILGCIDSPTSGNLFLEDDDLTKKDSRSLAFLRREKFGFIFQTYNLIPVLSVYENVALPLKLLGESRQTIEEKVGRVLDDMDIAGLEKRKPSQVSGGQQQRVSIARALVKKPLLILADEPTANLDSKIGETILAQMRDLNQKEGITFIFSTHDPRVLEKARRIVKLRDGNIEN